MESIKDEWPEEVKANWSEKLTTLCGHVYYEIGEIQQFAEAYDR